MDSTGWGTTGGGLRGGGAKWEPGLQVGEFRVCDKLGQGGMGVVWRVEHVQSGTQFAMKTLAIEANPQAIARFQREGQAQAMVDAHSNVVRVRSAGEHLGQLYMVMDLASGGDLKDRLRQGPMPPLEAAQLVHDLCGGLAHVHARGILHRDLKPPNVLFDEAGVPKLVDFGVARLKGQDRLTQTGTMLGTPSYMPPEQVDGRRDEIDERADVYGMGAILYECLTGEPPFRGTVANVIKAVLTDEPAPPRTKNPDVPADLETVCLQALAKDRFERYASAKEMAADLARVVRGDRIGAQARGSSRAPQLAALILVLGLVLGGAVVLGSRTPEPTPTPAITSSGPTLVLEVTVAPSEPVSEPTVNLAGTSNASKVEYEVDGERQTTSVLGGTFDFDLELTRVGVTEVSLTPLTGSHRGPTTRIELTRGPPRWYEQLDPSDRPALPLRDRLTFGAQAGTYVFRDEVELVYVPAGSFLQGIDEGSVEGDFYVENGYLASPAHQVTLSEPFFLGRYEVTRAQFERFCEASLRKPPPRLSASGYRSAPDHPVVLVSWRDAQEFCTWARVRLPSEAEWNYAAAGPDAFTYPWAPKLDITDGTRLIPANVAESLSNDGAPGDGFAVLAPVGSYPTGTSPFGAHDMAGNVREWVHDWWGRYPKTDQTDPVGPDSGAERVLRGGGWRDGMNWSNTWMRERESADVRDETTGFRVALSVR